MILSISQANILPGIVKHFENSFNKLDLTFELPLRLVEIELQGKGIEVVKSNTIQPLKLIYSHNIIRKGIASIFVNTRCDKCIYPDAVEKGNLAARIFTDALNFNKVTTYTDLTFKEIVDEMEALKKIS